MDDQQLGARVRALRQVRGWKQARLAQQCGWSAAKLSKMERGRQPVTAVELVRIAQAMQVPIQYLLSELGAASPAEPFRVLLPLPQASAGLCLRLTFRADGLEIVQLSPEAEREIPCLWPAAT